MSTHTIILASLLLGLLGCVQGVCTGIGGDFCEGTCCMSPNGTIEYCCSNFPFPTTCCGLGMCCPEEDTCSMNCTSNSTACISGTTPTTTLLPVQTTDIRSVQIIEHHDDESCDLSQAQCCMGTCCDACCGGTICAPKDHHCCNPPAGSAMDPTSFCELDKPSCCLDTDGNTTCCASGSQCCSEGSCPADSICCGSCNCCNTKTQRCLDDGSCEHVPQGVIIPILLWLWGVAFFSNLAFLGVKYYERMNLNKVQSTVCLECFHPAHCTIEVCDNKSVNTSPDCATCAQHCQRPRCHLGPCGIPYTAQERMIHEGDDEGETVSFKVVHAKCPCEECQCQRCVPYFACWCVQCQCASCRSSNNMRPHVISLVNGCVVLFTTFMLHMLADKNDCTSSLILFGSIWVAGSACMVVYFYYFEPKRKAARSSAPGGLAAGPASQQQPPTPDANVATNEAPGSYSSQAAYGPVH
eukprot:TRINITY_DN24397_c0_g1_i1.p1 TRINITY_DN24397_c0_g1~~TRINITY_DN24397_c0_g1_i1.p1  ORF type:complete len:497 (+),score=50.18 TRINITY_DN24397_c0_g1_i1:93-1493(+)